MKKKYIALLFIFTICSAFSYAQDSERDAEGAPRDESVFITNKGAEAYFHSEYTRGLNYAGKFSVLGDLELYNMYLFRGGLSIGKLGETANMDASLSAAVSPFSRKYLSPLSFSLRWVYNGLFDYEAHTHSILPFITYGADRAGISAGFNFRFSSYFFEPAQFELIFSFLLYFNLINNDDLKIGIRWGTIDDFYALNLGGMILSLDAQVRLNGSFSIMNEIELMQSGIDGFSANFYGFAWKGGVRFSW